jgi:CBS domain-containing protein
MRRLIVRDVMTHDVITVRTDTSFKEIARQLGENNISALPVLDDHGRLVGVVSEADLLHKEGRRGRARKSGPLALVGRMRRAVVKAAGGTAGDIMTSPAVTIEPDATLAEAARFMARRGVKRLPVVTVAGQLIGIVSRADLVSAFLRTDVAISEEIEQLLTSHVLLTEDGAINVQVRDGVVTLTGELGRRSSAEIADRLTREVDSVVDVQTELTYRWDDSKLVK